MSATTNYGKDFIAVLERGNIAATQFHPEKSGSAGLDVLNSFLEGASAPETQHQASNGEQQLLELEAAEGMSFSPAMTGCSD